MTQRWMVIWTRPGAEHDTAQDLRALRLAALVPAVRRFGPVNRWARNRGAGKFGKRERVLSPAFPRYIMFAATIEQPIWQLAIDLDGVSAIVRQAGNREAPALLPSKVAEALHGPLGDGVIEDLTETVDEMVRFAAGADITVTEGPFASFPGTVIGHEGRNVRVLLSILGGHREAMISPEAIREVA